MNQRGFGKAEFDVSINAHVIRGREQILIDFYGGAQSMGGTSANTINSIGMNNKNMRTYVDTAAKELYGSH
jgi:hypothetical protein